MRGPGRGSLGGLRRPDCWPYIGWFRVIGWVMPKGAIETALREVITNAVWKVATFNRARARNRAGVHPFVTGLDDPLTREVVLEELAGTGTLPAGLAGCFLSIGANPVKRPNPARYHWFAGDGMVHGVRIADGRALWYRNRWIRSSAVSQVLGEPPAPGPRLMQMAAVNTSVIRHAGRLWALVEAGGTPVELDATLGTVSHNPFGGTLRGAFSAHPVCDPETGELHAVCYLASDTARVHYVVVGVDGRVRREDPIAVQHGPGIHGCAITGRFVLVFDLPMTLSMRAVLAGYEYPYRWNPKHRARVGLLKRAAEGVEVIWCDAPACYVFHACNAFDLPDGRVVVDVIVHEPHETQDHRGPNTAACRFERWTIDPATGDVTRRVLDDTPQEFPRLDERRTGQPYRYAYAKRAATGATAMHDTALLKHDLEAGTREVHDFGPGQIPGEFVFVAAPEDQPGGRAEDDGWLMGFVVDVEADTTRLVMLDASKFGAPPVASVLLPHRIPPGFHGNWVSDGSF